MPWCLGKCRANVSTFSFSTPLSYSDTSHLNERPDPTQQTRCLLTSQSEFFPIASAIVQVKLMVEFRLYTSIYM